MKTRIELTPSFWLVSCALCLGGIAGAHAQQYPSKPVRFICPFAPGGGTDVLARMLSAGMMETFGQPVIVDNRPGAGGVIGADLAAKAPADGYTIVLGSPGSLTINPNLQKVPYDTLRDFAPITLATISPFVLVVNPSATAANSVKELIALAKAKPGQMNYGSAGTGSVSHFSSEQFKSLAGINVTQIPFKGAGPAVTDLLAGRLNFMFENLPTVIPHVRSGKLKMLAVGTKTRSKILPEYPTVAEAGVPGYESSTAFGVLAPARTPAAIITRLNRDLDNVIHSAGFRDKQAAQGVEAVGGTPQEYAAHLKEELAKYARVVKATGIKAE